MGEQMFGAKIPILDKLSRILWKIMDKPVMKMSYTQRLIQRFEILYPNRKPEEVVREYMCYKLSLMIVIVCVAGIAGLVMWSRNTGSPAVVDTIERNSYWGNEKEESLLVEVEGVQGTQEMMIPVPERKYNEDKTQKLLDKMGKSLEKTILNGNESLDCIRGNLNLVNNIPDTRVKVQWSMDNSEYINMDGTLIADAITRDGVVVNLMAELSYGEIKSMHSFAVCLMKPVLSEKEQLIREIQGEIAVRNVSQAGAKQLILPEKVQNKKVTFSQEQHSSGGIVVGMIVLAGILLFFVKDEQLQKQLEERKKQMLLDYSEIVSKLTLLLGAGMTIRRALEKIAMDYNKARKSHGERRYAYDEILYVCREMQGGVSEKAGIDMLSVRCQIPCYMKLCSLLLQNLKKGSKGMAQSLSYEVGQAFEEQKNIARRLGEEAGTKLLFPMILMLVIVMVILIVPAFLSF